jgi:hypothetical protein
MDLFSTTAARLVRAALRVRGAPTLAGAAVLCSAVLSGGSFAQGQAPQPTDVGRQVARLEVLPVPFAEAVERAARDGRMLVLLWTSAETGGSERLERALALDAPFCAWAETHALLVGLDQARSFAEASAANVTRYPCVDLYDPARKTIVERVGEPRNGAVLRASFTGHRVGGAAPPKPTGEAAREVDAWLGFANLARLTRETAVEAAHAYGLLLRQGEELQPGFRARHFEFLCRRLAELKPLSRDAWMLLDAERAYLEQELLAGLGTPRNAHELARVDWWLRQGARTRATYHALGAGGDAVRALQRPLLRHVLYDLARWQEFGPLLAGLAGESPVAYLTGRLRQVAADEAALAEGLPLPDDHDDTRAALTEDASWLYEALLAAGRGAEARAVEDFVAEHLATGQAFGLLVQRTVRRGMFAVGRRVAARGFELVEDPVERRAIEGALAQLEAAERAASGAGGGR